MRIFRDVDDVADYLTGSAGTEAPKYTEDAAVAEETASHRPPSVGGTSPTTTGGVPSYLDFCQLNGLDPMQGTSLDAYYFAHPEEVERIRRHEAEAVDAYEERHWGHEL